MPELPTPPSHRRRLRPPRLSASAPSARQGHAELVAPGAPGTVHAQPGSNDDTSELKVARCMPSSAFKSKEKSWWPVAVSGVVSEANSCGRAELQGRVEETS